MATHDYIISNASGAAVRADLNNALAAIATNNSSATAPATTYAYQWWADTGSSPTVMKLRNAANSAWITLFQLDGEWTSLALENGTAAAPSIYFKDSGTDTGIYSPGADQVAITTGGIQKLVVDSDGKVGIGANSPAERLHVFTGTNNDANIARFTGAQNTKGLLIGTYSAGGNDGGVQLTSSYELRLATNGSQQMLVTSGGQVQFQTYIAGGGNVGSAFIPGANSTDYLRMLSVGTGAATLQIFGNNNGNIGSITTVGSSTSFNTSSDYRLKENIIPVPDAISRLQQLKPSRFNFKADPDRTVDGFIAHEAQAVVPECVTGEKDAVDDDGNPVMQGIDQSKLVPLLTAALQEATAKIETLEARLTAAGIE